MAKKPVISAKNVWKIFGANPKKYLSQISADYSFEQIKEDGYIAGVKDVSIDVHKGEMLVIMGLSGSGKSTLVRCLSRLHDITGGTISVDNQDIMSLTEKELIELRRSKMGMVFQNFGLLPHLNVIENIAFPLKLQGLKEKERIKKAERVIDLVGLAGRENNFIKELSGGQQQRVGIARSLAVEPDVWFLDEPFSALDPLIRKQMQDEFLRIQSIQKKSVVFITHDFQEALRIADRIALMRDGQIVQIGKPVDLILSPKDNYVREFTKDIPWESVLQASDIIDKGKKISETAEQVPLDMPVAKMLHLLSKKSTGVVVINRSGKKIGMATAQSFVAALATAEN